MRPSAIIIAAQNFISTVMEGPLPTVDAIARSLDQIAVASHKMPPGRCAGNSERWWRSEWIAPDIPLAERFADLGLYIVADPLGDVKQSPYHGDAIDDLSDIASTMREAIWRSQRRGNGDAHWFLRNQQFHWERHLRELALYLHARRFQ